MFGERRSVLRLLPHVLRRRGGRPGRGRDAGRPRPRSRPRGRGATSSRRSSCRSTTPITARRGGCRSSTTATRAPSTCAFPPGVGDGSRVRIAGEGEIGSGGAKSGDLYLRIRLAPHPRFERKGKDLYTQRPRPAHDRGARRRSGGADACRQDAAAEDSGDDAERPDVPPEGARHADERTSRNPATSTQPWRCSCRRR